MANVTAMISSAASTNTLIAIMMQHALDTHLPQFR
jgi:hypothetical protein